MRFIELENKYLTIKGCTRKVSLVKMIDEKHHVRYGVVSVKPHRDNLDSKLVYCWNRGFNDKQEAVNQYKSI